MDDNDIGVTAGEPDEDDGVPGLALAPRNTVSVWGARGTETADRQLPQRVRPERAALSAVAAPGTGDLCHGSIVAPIAEATFARSTDRRGRP